ncbi:MAG: 4-(cytidine 5'-diphospho)-2-C-methyl-D-erythritol kinase [Bacteroidota bacterium]|nr:4-(cytidine 5'-diphospho)-2-C-methyl-D-erythritol kinase [Bacteroidota bacterium]
MIFFPNCKINIGLFVTGKRKDGYHNLESIFYPLGLCDALEMRINKEGKTKFSLSGLGVKEGYVKEDENNSVLKAFRLLEKDFPNIKSVKIHLNKGIPCFAGLGGGSSDATFCLKLTDFKFNLNLSSEQYHHYASMLGSDNMFFVENRASFVCGRGEKMKKHSLSLKDYFVVLIKPNLNISTKEAYSNVNITKKPFDLRNLRVENIREWKNYVRNDFEQGLFEKHPILLQIKQMLYDMGAMYAQMSGSGATVFGIFEKEQDLGELRKNKELFVYQEKIKQ